MPSSRRDHLVETAQRLFYAGGYHATGIDKVLAEAGVAKMTLYKYFKSKDELILAALRRRDETFRNWFMRGVERRAAAPRDRLLAAFDILAEWFVQPEFSGCMFVKASAEYGAKDDPIHAAAAEHKRLVAAYLSELAAAAGAEDPAELAQDIMLLMEGAMVMAQFVDGAETARRARRVAVALLDSRLPA